MKRNVTAILLFIAVYCVLITAYFLMQPAYHTPPELQGTPADPRTFMSDSEILKVHQYATIRYLAYFLSSPYQWLLLLILFLSGFADRVRERVSRRFRNFFLQTAVFIALLSLILAVLTLPVDILLFALKIKYGLTRQPWLSWLWDAAKSFLVDTAIYIPVVFALLYYIRKNAGRWWLNLWLWSIPFTFLFVFITPVVIDPVFNDFKSLQDAALKQDILSLAQKAGIAAHDVYEVDMSRQTTALNAYVNGIGNTARIVLWDTTLAKMNRDEILSIMAHEMGHYVKKHVIWGTAIGVAGNLVFFYLLNKLYGRTLRRLGGAERKPYDPSSLPVLALLASVVLFFSSPVQSAISRVMERQADEYSIAMMKNPDAGVSSFQKLAKYNLSETRPPELVNFFLGSHPTLEERIVFEQKYKPMIGHIQGKNSTP